MVNHIGTQSIETERLLLRKFKIEDAQPMFENWAKDPENTQYLSWTAHLNSGTTKNILTEWIKDYNKKNCYRWAIILKETGKRIGGIDVVLLMEHIDCCEIGYVLSKQHWNQGIMTEALKAVIDYLFERANFNRIQARHDIENPASGKVMQKSGMTYEGTLWQSDIKNTGGLCDLAIYSILRSNWLKSKNLKVNKKEDISIFKAESKHLNEVYNLICILENKIFDQENFVNMYMQNISDPNTHYYVALKDEKVIGFISLHIQRLLHFCKRVGEVQQLIISEEYRGKNVGKKLMDKAKEIAKSENCHVMEVCVRKENSNGYRFYRKQRMSDTHNKLRFNLEDYNKTYNIT